MKRRMFFHWSLIVVLLGSALCGQDKIEPPVLERQIEPDYPPDLKTFVIDPLIVEMVIDQEGIPFSVKSAAGLTDNVVQALAKWRFHPARKSGAPIAYMISIRVPVHKSIGEMMGRMKRSWSITKQINDAFVAAKELDATKAAKMEDDLAAGPQNLDTRLTLLAHAATTNGPETATLQLRQILWLAKNEPKAEILSTPSAVPKNTTTDPTLYDQVRQIWLSQLSENPRDPVT